MHDLLVARLALAIVDVANVGLASVASQSLTFAKSASVHGALALLSVGTVVFADVAVTHLSLSKFAVANLRPTQLETFILAVVKCSF